MSQKFVRRDRDPLRPRCPECGSGQLNKNLATYSCAYCRHSFAHAAAKTDAQHGQPITPRTAPCKTKGVTRSNAGSGVIAPPPYRTGFRWGASWL